jgi:hypothetical protein
MEVENEKNKVKKQLEQELQNVRFTKHQEVMNRTHPVSFKHKLASFWNKEIEIPLLPIGAALTLLLFSWGISGFNPEQQTTTPERELVEFGGNMYWKDELEKVVVFHED